MAKENQIVAEINKAIKTALKHEKFSGAQLVGITQLVQYDGKIIPCIVDNDGEAHWVDIDDAKPLQIYHRNNGYQQPMKDEDQNFPGTRKQLVSMSLFAIAQRKMIKMTVEDLFTLIHDALLLTKIKLSELTLKQCNVTFQSADVNALNVSKREQPNKTLDPQVIMFELKYQLECSYNKDCINTLCCD